MDEKIAAGVFAFSLTPPTESGNPEYAGEYSVLVFLKTAKGRHVGTIHYMIDSMGQPLEHDGYRHLPHPKAYRLRDGTMVRTAENQELERPPRKRRQRQDDQERAAPLDEQG